MNLQDHCLKDVVCEYVQNIDKRNVRAEDLLTLVNYTNDDFEVDKSWMSEIMEKFAFIFQFFHISGKYNCFLLTDLEINLRLCIMMLKLNSNASASVRNVSLYWQI